MCIKFVAVCSPINDCHSTRIYASLYRNFNYAGRRLFDGFLQHREAIQRKIKQLCPNPSLQWDYFNWSNENTLWNVDALFEMTLYDRLCFWSNECHSVHLSIFDRINYHIIKWSVCKFIRCVINRGYIRKMAAKVQWSIRTSNADFNRFHGRSKSRRTNPSLFKKIEKADEQICNLQMSKLNVYNI